MSMKRMSVLCFQGSFSLPMIIGLSIAPSGFAIFFGLFVRLMGIFHPPDIPFTPPQYLMWLEMLSPFVAVMAGAAFILLIRSEKTNETSELLFSTPISALEYMLSLWLVLVFGGAVGIYVTMGVYVFSAGVEHLATVSPFIWLQPLPMAITWVSAGGLLGIILMLESSLIKKTVYAFIVFIPLLAVTAWVMISIFITPVGAVAAELLPAWVLAVPSFIHLHWARWLPTAIYTLLWFFLLIRRIDVRNFIYPVRQSLSRKWEEIIPW